MKEISKSEFLNQLEHDVELTKYWKDWFMITRCDIVCAAFVSGEFAKLYLKVAKQCGAIKGKFCADGTVQVTFPNMPESSSTCF